MPARIHDDEPDTSERVARALLEAECPQWARAPLRYLATSGTDNAMWRIGVENGPDVVMRLPRRPGAAAAVEQEMTVLRHLEAVAGSLPVATPQVRHVGHAQQVFPHQWSVLGWLDGTDAWTGRGDLAGRRLGGLAEDLARSVNVIGALSAEAVRQRAAGDRGGPLLALLERLDAWLDDPRWNASGLLDVDAVKRLADEAREAADEGVVEGFVHGDLIPGNLLVDGDRLSAIIDWGGAGRGDVAQDFAPAWSVLTAAERPAFREAVDADEAAWIRGRTFELEHAVGGVVYYVPRLHALGDVMTRTLDRILSDS